MSVLIVNSAAPGEQVFIEPILETIGSQYRSSQEMGAGVEVCHWTDLEAKKDIGPYAAVIISASPMGDNASFWERVQTMKHKQLPIYGVQWHAEISTPRLILNLLEMCW